MKRITHSSQRKPLASLRKPPITGPGKVSMGVIKNKNRTMRVCTKGGSKERRYKVERIDKSSQSRLPKIGIRASANRNNSASEKASEGAADNQGREVLRQA